MQTTRDRSHTPLARSHEQPSETISRAAESAKEEVEAVASTMAAEAKRIVPRRGSMSMKTAAVILTAALSWIAHAVASQNWSILTTGYSSFPRVIVRSAAVAPALLFSLYLVAHSKRLQELSLMTAIGTHMFYLYNLAVRLKAFYPSVASSILQDSSHPLLSYLPWYMPFIAFTAASLLLCFYGVQAIRTGKDPLSSFRGRWACLLVWTVFATFYADQFMMGMKSGSIVDKIFPAGMLFALGAGLIKSRLHRLIA